MITDSSKATYKTTIGIECHVQLKTKTKLFSGIDNDAREAPVNTLLSPLCLGMPGTLPVLNSEAVHLASKAAFALNTKPSTYSAFDRKHYFYPDLPKGYQITQFDKPIVVGGYVQIETADGLKKIGITRAHLEEDAGKSTHPDGKDYSLVDLNRAGTPLLEIVSEPEIHSAEEAKAYAHELYLLMRYADVSDANLYYGNMRFDVNISVSKDANKLGTRAEIKNLNSFRSVEKAVEYEVERQIEILEKGGIVVQETRGWDDAKQKTIPQRSKEDAHDYRYFPDPDIPPISLTDEYISAVQSEMPTMPSAYRDQLRNLKLDRSQIESLLEEPLAVGIVHNMAEAHGDKTAKMVANWLTGEVTRLVSDSVLNWQLVAAASSRFKELSALVDDGKLSSTAAKEVIAPMVKANKSPETIASELDLIQQSDAGALEMLVVQVIADNARAVEDIKNGEEKAIGFLVGQVMKASKGKANPQIVQELIRSNIH